MIIMRVYCHFVDLEFLWQFVLTPVSQQEYDNFQSLRRAKLPSRMQVPVENEDTIIDEVTRELHSFLFILKLLKIGTEKNFTCGPEPTCVPCESGHNC